MEKMHRIHVIDDEPIIHEVLGELLSSEGYKVEISASGTEALKKHETDFFDLVLLDLLMPGMNGIDVLKELKKRHPDIVIIIITAYASVESAITAMKIGAYDYIQKPFKHDELLLTVKRAISHKDLQDENIRLKGELGKKFGFSNIIGKSPLIRNVFETIRASAPTRSTILIEGESGTGKELVAHAVHLNSDRSQQPFIVVNSGSLPPDLLESNLFGHVKGAFTGATAQKKGLFEAADRGTIFFDEISSVGNETQTKLLRVIQEREFMRLGGTTTVRVDVRIIAATNIDLRELIRQQKFREDLYYRLNVIKIELPPLRKRKDDIPLLVKHFIDIYCRENKKEITGINDDVMSTLMDYDWPGNIRELENLIERAIVLTRSKRITRDILPPSLLDIRKDSPKNGSEFRENLDLKVQTQNFQRRAILNALKRAKGVQKKAAQLLGIKPTTLNEMIKRLDIDIDHIFK
ncbi:MAG: sigma-54 dependent transcriptional regulator [Acidobacteria bacterium]|nr:sigma-54 dependent transcriptional regulator [Acidobacteriota bacterium]MBU1474931.1 sigma-54 dependent transcriptional regulator [Acidobacteriota bacterium]MCG2815526.1 sigma-54 dependent transcriptional regulator [Candidatus Aminicenantes bacterium]